MSITPKALWYIESHLGEELPLESVADVAGVSRFHLCRAFSVSANCPLSAYVRARRLSEAAKVLARGAPDILTVALAAGYGSHEAFTRAFRQHFGVTPEQLRAQGCLEKLKIQEAFSMSEATLCRLESPRVVKSEALLIFGLGEHYECRSNAGIPSQWSRFLPHFGHIPGQVGKVAYGVVYNCDDVGNYDYLCGVEVPEFPSHPPDFTRLRIPPAQYLVFEHRDHISTINSTWKAVWEQGVAASDHKVADGPAFERYGEQFDGRTGRGGVELWVPIQT